MIALLTNDDGIEADGLKALEEIAADYFESVWVVAPADQMSQIGHRVTTDTPIRIEQKGERSFAVHGTPADCTRVALAHLLPERPDWILSGINHGGNLGKHDFVISGTVAAVREGAFAGIKGAAFSHFMKRGLELDWENASQWVKAAFDSFIEEETERGEFWTVNLPHPAPGEPEPKVVRCEQEPHPLLVAYEQVSDDELVYVGDYHERPRREGSDVDVCFGGDISVSLVTV
ncbi:MAG: 5'/3'-nucleotidase SurE [Verrucomicrobiales bacterium]|nr:5'/3'-nucleotidase SurE [Verrucomicrobiales bacterium]